MKRATISDAPAALNTNDKAMWVLGFNAALEKAPARAVPCLAALMEAASDAARQGFVPGTTNWAAAMQHALAYGVKGPDHG